MKQFRIKALAFVVAFATLIAACAETTAPVQEPELTVVQTDSAQFIDLLGLIKKTLYLQCSPLPTASDSKLIGPAGGTLSVGPHKLVIPAGALTVPTQITATAPSGTVNRLEFAPHGLQFAKDPKLTMSYANCGLIFGLLPRHITYTDDNLRPLELLDAVPNLLKKETTAEIEHFSDYVLSW